LATKQETIDFIIANYPFEQLMDDLLQVEFTIEDSRSQQVFVWVDETFALLQSPFSQEDAITADEALEAAGHCNFGVRRFAGCFVLSHLILLKDLDESELVDGMLSLIVMADEIEESLSDTDEL
jgi:hypothetical protein